MQTCSQCQTQSMDEIKICPACQADLSKYSTSAVILKKFRNNPRVTAIRVSAPEHACPVCQKVCGTYPKDKAPVLPVPGCSDLQGCLNFYEPFLDVIYP